MTQHLSLKKKSGQLAFKYNQMMTLIQQFLTTGFYSNFADMKTLT